MIDIICRDFGLDTVEIVCLERQHHDGTQRILQQPLIDLECDSSPWTEWPETSWESINLQAALRFAGTFFACLRLSEGVRPAGWREIFGQIVGSARACVKRLSQAENSFKT